MFKKKGCLPGSTKSKRAPSLWLDYPEGLRLRGAAAVRGVRSTQAAETNITVQFSLMSAVFDLDSDVYEPGGQDTIGQSSPI